MKGNHTSQSVFSHVSDGRERGREGGRRKGGREGGEGGNDAFDGAEGEIKFLCCNLLSSFCLFDTPSHP